MGNYTQAARRIVRDAVAARLVLEQAVAGAETILEQASEALKGHEVGPCVGDGMEWWRHYVSAITLYTRLANVQQGIELWKTAGALALAEAHEPGTAWHRDTEDAAHCLAATVLENEATMATGWEE